MRIKHYSLAFLCILLFAGCSAAQSKKDSVENLKPNKITIATFNLRVLSDRSRSDAELRDIAQLIVGFDVLAIQEARDIQVVERLIRILHSDFGLDYQFSNSPPLGRGSHEIYVFLWRTDRIRPLSEIAVVPDPNDEFSREPAWQEFAALNSDKTPGFDFVLADFHAIFGSSQAVRQAEAKHIPEAIRHIEATVHKQAGMAGEGDFLLAGDFNLSCMDAAFDDLRALGMEPVNPGLGTTIKDSPYDNIWYYPSFTIEYSREWGMIKFDETMFDGNDALASQAISDHRPIWAICANEPDDDK